MNFIIISKCMVTWYFFISINDKLKVVKLHG